MAIAPGYRIRVGWTSDSGPQSAVYGVDVGLCDDAAAAMDTAIAIAQPMISAKAAIKGGNAFNFTASVEEIIPAPDEVRAP